jgi:hypothetical protein
VKCNDAGATISQGLKPVYGSTVVVRAKARTYLRCNGKGRSLRDDSQKSKSERRSRFPEGMTERKATATTNARAKATTKARAKAEAVPGGNNRKNGEGNYMDNV